MAANEATIVPCVFASMLPLPQQPLPASPPSVFLVHLINWPFDQVVAHMTAAAAALSPLCPVIKEPHGSELISPTSDSSSSLFFLFLRFAGRAGAGCINLLVDQ